MAENIVTIAQIIDETYKRPSVTNRDLNGVAVYYRAIATLMKVIGIEPEFCSKILHEIAVERHRIKTTEH